MVSFTLFRLFLVGPEIDPFVDQEATRLRQQWTHACETCSMPISGLLEALRKAAIQLQWNCFVPFVNGARCGQMRMTG